MPSHASQPVYADFPSENLTRAAGVAIFHLSTERVVVCYHTREKHWFLPKGRVNANEDTRRAAEREGFEESGYRNRLLPLPLSHRQPDPDEGKQEFVTQPLWSQLAPVGRSSQYILFWYAAETIPPNDELSYLGDAADSDRPVQIYKSPPSFPVDTTLRKRIALDSLTGADGKPIQYEPVRHEGTGVDEDELQYTSFLLSIDEACQKLKGSVMANVVRRAWEGIQLRLRMENGESN